MRTLAFVALLIATTATIAIADTSISSVPQRAVRATGTDSAIHLDLSLGFESEHNNQDQIANGYHYGAVLFKNFTTKLKVFAYGGEAIEDEQMIGMGVMPQAGLIGMRMPGVGPALRQPAFGAFVYNTGLTYKVSPGMSMTASYNQGLGHSYHPTGETITHAINLQTDLHVL